MPLCSVRLESDDTAPARDPYRSLAAAILWRAIQDAFCGKKRTPNVGLCAGQFSCAKCRDRAIEWLLSPDGLRMADNAGLDADAVRQRLTEMIAARLRLRPRRGGNPVWVTTR